MPATVRIIHATDFIKATAEGELDLEESKRLLVEIASATDLADCEVILDTREAHSTLSAADLWHFAAASAAFVRPFLERPPFFVHKNDLITQRSSRLPPEQRFQSPCIHVLRGRHGLADVE